MFKHENLDLVDLIDVIVDNVRFEFPNNTLTSDLPNRAPLYKSNHKAVGQALENIIRNALRYAPSDKAIEVNLSSNENSYTLLVRDSGPGVPKQMLESIFQPFFRVDKSRTGSDGFGLGLPLAKRQLETVKGTILAKNRPTGGLDMIVTLPKNPAI